MEILKVLSAVLILFVTSLNFTSCANKEKDINSLADSLNRENNNLTSNLTDKEAAIVEFVGAFNEIQENLNAIKAKEKIVVNSSLQSDIKSSQNKIKEDLKDIYELLEKNKIQISTLIKDLNNSGLKLKGLQEMIENLQKSINIKDEEIAELKSKVEKLYSELKNLTAGYKVIEQENIKKAEMLSTAYYLIGTSKDLEEKNVITKEGGFIGIGKVTKVKEDFNKELFTKVNIATVTSIKIRSKKVKIITSHPKESYKLVGKSPVEMLEIINYKDFWGVSKYLVVIIE